MSKKKRIIVKLFSSVTKHFYTTTKNKKNKSLLISIKKFDPFIRKHVIYKEKK